MNLQDFIKETLTEIIAGVSGAQQQIKQGEIVAVHQVSDQAVVFDVAVTTSTSKEGGGKVSVLGLGAGMEGKSTTEAVSRIKFSVPVELPRMRRT